MQDYYLIKLLHILSATVLFGTGVGTAFFMLRAHFSGNLEAMRVVTKNAVLADWVFTTPAVVVQLITGLWLTFRLSIPPGSAWFISVICLYLFVGACWIPVVYIQIKIGKIVSGGGSRADCQRLMHIWVSLGVLAFIAMLTIFYLMVMKPGISIMIR